jgi:hypothetical protein
LSWNEIDAPSNSSPKQMTLSGFMASLIAFRNIKASGWLYGQCASEINNTLLFKANHPWFSLIVAEFTEISSYSESRCSISLTLASLKPWARI